MAESRVEAARRRAEERAGQQAEQMAPIGADEQAVKLALEHLDLTDKANELLAQRPEILDGILKQGEKVEKNLLSYAKQIPIVGDSLEKFLKKKFEELGGEGGLSDMIYDKMIKNTKATDTWGQAMKRIVTKNPLTALLVVGVALAGVIIKIRNAARDLGDNLNVSTKQAMKMLPGLKIQEMKFKAMGLDATKIKITMTALADEFGSLEHVNAKNAAHISRMAQNLGVSGKELVSFSKTMMDLTGASLDTANNMAQTAADMAKAANVGTGKVLADMSANAEAFAQYAMDGAEGMAKAAIEAAKIGGSLSTVLGAADKLLSFESSLTAQFKAQVLSGKQLNLERARQLSLEGDIAGLTEEIQSVVGGLGDIQAMNVIQRQAVADAIGINVRDLQRIAAGEQAEAQETVQDKLNETNTILRDIAGYTEETANKKPAERLSPVF